MKQHHAQRPFMLAKERIDVLQGVIAKQFAAPDIPHALGRQHGGIRNRLQR